MTECKFCGMLLVESVNGFCPTDCEDVSNSNNVVFETEGDVTSFHVGD